MSQWLRRAGGAFLVGLLPMFVHGESLDIAHSQIQFYGTQMGAQVEGRFQRFFVNLHFDPNDLGHSSVHLVIDLNSIDLASEESEDEIKGTHWFNTARFPQAVFDSSGFQKSGNHHYLVTGTLQIKGMKQPVQIPLEITQAGQQRIAQGHFVLYRHRFAVGDGTWAATDSVKDEVVVRYRLTLNP